MLFRYRLLIPSLFFLLLGACETAIPDDMMFCKSEEVYVLASAFDEKSAIIVMYRGDDVRLLGDTAYQQAITPEMKVDSSVYYVKVKAKRGVIGWVHAKDLQHDRPKIQTRKPKESVVIEKIETPELTVDSSLIALDTLVEMNDSLWSLWMGTYTFSADSSDKPELFRIVCAQKDSMHLLFDFSRTEAEDCNHNLKGVARLQFNKALYSKDSCKFRIRFDPPFLELKRTGTCGKTDSDCNFEYKLKKVKGKGTSNK